ncbi:unnamed protein product [Protopolystoma xenopodis]|uniref:Uncharacterized protein n=1 Tax=Protopolystoma xenopodis TaxID=117903 RepID=A0A448X4R3_9PLAT|nr:unnamed protein product [Protopolystoma xenopodis]
MRIADSPAQPEIAPPVAPVSSPPEQPTPTPTPTSTSTPTPTPTSTPRPTTSRCPPGRTGRTDWPAVLSGSVRYRPIEPHVHAPTASSHLLTRRSATRSLPSVDRTAA